MKGSNLSSATTSEYSSVIRASAFQAEGRGFESHYSLMNIFKEKAGVLSPEEVWVCICEGYIYIADTLEQLIEILNTEWKNERHLVG